MQIYSLSKRFFSVSMLLMMLFAAQIMPAYAADPAAYISVGFGSETFGTIVIGRSLPLYISISIGPNPVRATSLQCFQNGTSLNASSISRLPNTILFAPNAGFNTEQYYRAVSAGATSVHCVFKGTDTVTGIPFTVTSLSADLVVSGEQRLYVDAYSGTQTAPVGELISLMVIYGNRGRNTLTNVQVSCSQLGRGIAFVGFHQTQTTVPSGQSGFAQYRLQGFFQGATGLFICGVAATDSITGELIVLNTRPVAINIR